LVEKRPPCGIEEPRRDPDFVEPEEVFVPAFRKGRVLPPPIADDPLAAPQICRKRPEVARALRRVRVDDQSSRPFPDVGSAPRPPLPEEVRNVRLPDRAGETALDRRRQHLCRVAEPGPEAVEAGDVDRTGRRARHALARSVPRLAPPHPDERTPARTPEQLRQRLPQGLAARLP